MKIALIAIMLVASAGARAALTVESYYEMLEKHGVDNQAIELQVRMYVDGLMDGLFLISHDLPEEKKSWCIPDDQHITDEIAFELFQQELRLRRDEYKEFAELDIQVPFSLVMVDALQRAFPCGGS